MGTNRNTNGQKPHYQSEQRPPKVDWFAIGILTLLALIWAVWALTRTRFMTWAGIDCSCACHRQSHDIKCDFCGCSRRAHPKLPITTQPPHA